MTSLTPPPATAHAGPESHATTSNIKSTRDLRVDFFRGIALLFIFTNHLAEFTGSPLLKLISWRTYGVSDAAELFIFLSGLIYGLVYDRVRARDGYGALVRKSWLRAVHLYGANFATFCVLLLFLPVLANMLGWRNPWANWLAVDAQGMIGKFLTLDKLPAFFDILPLYMILLVVMPFMLMLYRWRPAVAWGLSLGVYALTHAIRSVKGGGGLGFNMYFNPFTWQLKFFIGMVLGLRRNDGSPPIRMPSALPWLCAAILLGSLAIKLRLHMAHYQIPGLGDGEAFASLIEPLIEKKNLMPWRVLHFLALAVVVVRLMPEAGHPFWKHPLTSLMRILGEHSLKIFCLGLGLCYLLDFVMTNTSDGLVMQMVMNLVGWGIMILLAVKLTKAKRRKMAQRRPAEAPPMEAAAAELQPQAIEIKT